jgi:hypothetical protein
MPVPEGLSAADATALERAARCLKSNLDRQLDTYLWRRPGIQSHYSPAGKLFEQVYTIRIGLGLGGWCAGMRRDSEFPLTAPYPEGRAAAEAVVDQLIAQMEGSGVQIVEPTVVSPQERAAAAKPRTCEKKVSKRYWNASHFARMQKANRANRRLYRRHGKAYLG